MQILPRQRKKIQQYSYALQDLIGKGFSSSVYLGRNDLNDSLVAVKVVSLTSLQNQFSKSMLQSEIDILRSLHHKHIVSCYDVFSTVNNCYIITQYCSEGDLASLLKKRRLSQTHALSIFRDIYIGYQELAIHKIIHRDLKPANIFVSEGRAKIADFGFAKRITDSEEPQKINVGTPMYMSPECLRKSMYSQKSDIWSLGVILFELTNGQPPWTARSQRQLLEKIMTIPLLFRNPLREEIRYVIKRCLQVDVQDRISWLELQQNSVVQKLLDQQLLLTKHVQPQSIFKQSRVGLKNSQMVMSQLNLCRFVVRLMRLGQKTASFPDLKELLSARVNLLKEVTQGETNSMNLQEWDQWIISQKALKLKLLARKENQLHIRQFNLLIPSPSNNLHHLPSLLSQFISFSINNLNLITQPLSTAAPFDPSLHSQAVLVDFTITLYQLLSLLDQFPQDFQLIGKVGRTDILAEREPLEMNKQLWTAVTKKAQILRLIE